MLADEVEGVLHVGEGEDLDADRRGSSHGYEDAGLDPRSDGRLGEREDCSGLGDLHALLAGCDPPVDVVERATALGVVLVGGQLLQRDQVVHDVDDRHAAKATPQLAGIGSKSKADTLPEPGTVSGEELPFSITWDVPGRSEGLGIHHVSFVPDDLAPAASAAVWEVTDTDPWAAHNGAVVEASSRTTSRGTKTTPGGALR